jgi:AraC-like DNA-binding protein
VAVKLNPIETPIHRFVSASDIHFKFITLTTDNFKEIDIAHRHGYWSVFVFLKGSGTHLIDFTELKIHSGSIHFVLPGQVHALNGGKDFLGYAMMFTEEFFLLRNETRHLLMKLFGFMDAGQPAVVDILKEEQEYFSSLFSLFQLEVQHKQASQSAILLDLLSVFISKCMQLLKLPPQASVANDSLQYIRFRNEVERNFRTIHTVAEYCQLLHITPKALNALTNTFAGITALDFIHQRILVEAKRLLKYSDKPVKEIAYDLHFTDAAHFAKFFKMKTELTPLEFKSK